MASGRKSAGDHCRQQKTHMAVVQSEFGDAVGIVTMSDVLNTLFEDILPDPDEHDELGA